WTTVTPMLTPRFLLAAGVVNGSIYAVGGATGGFSASAIVEAFKPGATHDFNGEGVSDIAWRDTTTGTVAAWLMNGLKVQQSGNFFPVTNNWLIVGQRDFDGDGKHDFLWRDGNTGTVAIWLLSGLSIGQTGSFGAIPSNWEIVGTGDFNGDGKGDILWRDNN